MIIKASKRDIPKIMEITKACAADMISKGIFQWNTHYPSISAFENDLNREELYVNIYNSQIIGAIVISTHMDDEYLPIQWLTPSDKNIYIHRLCVHPQYQGMGKAGEAMTFAESLAREKGAASVRLDTFSKNPVNNRFYSNRGYQKLGDIFFPKQSEYPFHCYELVL